MLLANVGLPMIVVELSLLVVALLPVVLLEAAIYRWRLSITWELSLWGTLRANLWSTFVGIPLAWFVQAFLQLTGGAGGIWELDTPANRIASVTLQSAWLVPHEGEWHWMIPAAALALLLPCFIVSVGSEQGLLRKYWPTVSASRVFSVAIQANLLSYMALAAYWIICLYSALTSNHA